MQTAAMVKGERETGTERVDKPTLLDDEKIEEGFERLKREKGKE